MKKIILLLTISICFAQELGMLHKKLGLTIFQTRSMGSEESDPQNGLKLAYLMNNGLEMGLSYRDTDFDNMAISIDYHVKSKGLFNLSLGYTRTEIEYENYTYYPGYYEQYYDNCYYYDYWYGCMGGWQDVYVPGFEYYSKIENLIHDINISIYNNNSSYISLTNRTYDESDNSNQYIGIGKIYNLFNGFNLGFDYIVNTEADLNDGDLTVKFIKVF